MKKPLPQIKSLEYSLTMPLSGKKIVYRPYTVADERDLIAASAARKTDKEFYLNNTLRVIKGVVTNDVDITKLSGIEVRYLLLNQRAKSVGEAIEVQFDGKPCEINIDQIALVNPKSKESYKIDIGGDLGIKMKDLSFEDEINYSIEDIPEDEDMATGARAKIFYNMIIDSVESIYNQDDVWVVGEDITREDVENFINDIPSNISKKLYDFIGEAPYMEAKVIIDGKEVTLTSKEVDFLA